MRAHKKKAARATVFSTRVSPIIEEENKVAVNILIAKILVYSAIKIIANGPALYSILNPETSSDSPSTRS